MKHGNVNRKFHRETKQRSALLVSLAVALIDKNKITTTQAKAKSLRPQIEKLVTKSKSPTVANRRLLISRVGEKPAHKLITELGVRFKDRQGGYTRIRTLAPRVSDGARMAVIEFID